MRVFLRVMMGATGLIALVGASQRQAAVAVPALVMCGLWGLVYLLYGHYQIMKADRGRRS